jgi:hypothetical protein
VRVWAIRSSNLTARASVAYAPPLRHVDGTNAVAPFPSGGRPGTKAAVRAGAAPSNYDAGADGLLNDGRSSC